MLKIFTFACRVWRFFGRRLELDKVHEKKMYVCYLLQTHRTEFQISCLNIFFNVWLNKLRLENNNKKMIRK